MMLLMDVWMFMAGPCQVCDAFQSYIWEPVLVKESALNAATEAACLILSIDETVKNPQLSALGTFGNIWEHLGTFGNIWEH